ncbi:MAG: cobyric acid synthase [Pseudomonadota bacterium]
MLAPTLMVQGTASSVGKSLLVTALCRLFRRQGLRVAPFKAQNMSLNSAVTPGGLEIGRAQAVQAEAAGVAAAVEMNPILLKPEGDARSQVVVLGKPMGSMTAVEYHGYKPQLRRVVADALLGLREGYDLVVIEGAGSPAEINLKEHDLVNMDVARLADAPVLLVGDIDRGGVFASFVGTLELLDPHERALVAAFVVNKFRGDMALLKDGLDFLTRRTGKPVLGVVPYIRNLRIAEEDSTSLEDRAARRGSDRDQLNITVIRLPRISNHDDFEPLEHETGVVVRFVERAEELRGADLVILPGSKNTVADLAWLRANGMFEALKTRARNGEPVLGICGGCQMLGEEIEDPYGVESSEKRVAALGLLPLKTRFAREKITAQIGALALDASFLHHKRAAQEGLSGYEIHMGVVERTRPCAIPFEIRTRNGREEQILEGAIDDTGAVVGTMIHGLFENDSVRNCLLAFLRKRKGLPDAASPRRIPAKEAEYDRLAAVVRAHLDYELLQRVTGLNLVPPA